MTQSAPIAIGSIDHVVIVVDDLARHAETYRRLGFTLSPRGVHSPALGTANHTIMLQRDYFELLSVMSPTERNATWRRAIASGGGIAGVALQTEDASAARTHWQGAGLDPEELIRFSRQVTRSDGAQLEARFEVVSLLEIANTGVRFFVCSQPTREAVWLPELMNHENTAKAIVGLTIAASDPASAADAWGRVVPGLTVTETSYGRRLRTGSNYIDVVRPDVARATYEAHLGDGQTRAVAMEFAVADLSATRRVLEANEVPFKEVSGALVVPPKAASAVQLCFSA